MAKKDSEVDEVLRTALRKAYTARAKMFVSEIKKRNLDSISAKLALLNSSEWDWSLAAGVTVAARDKVVGSSTPLHLVFCHPSAMRECKGSLAYYRSLAALSTKGLLQMLRGTPAAERERARCVEINTILSIVVEDMEVFDLQLLRTVIPAEQGSEIQGTWVNAIGRGAAKYVADLFEKHATEHGFLKEKKKHSVTILGKKRNFTQLVLTNGWTITFGDEPDVSIRDASDLLASAIEIKGSMDVAGAQTRYGEAKKSFQKAHRENGQCETIYLASCFTASVTEQIKQDPQVRKVLNLAEIMSDEQERDKFLSEIFDHIIRISVTPQHPA